jgi:putative FmdB family regulatory protein
MPTYEYVCSKCEHHFEKVQRITDDALKICPKEFCPRKPWGKGKISRAISTGGGLIFKGSGFYTTDYRSESYKEAAKKDATASSPAAASTASDGAKKETKSAESAPAKPTPAAAPAKKASSSE